jgi:hypothetical protein
MCAHINDTDCVGGESRHQPTGEKPMYLSAPELSRLQATFAEFMVRDGYSRDHAISELSILLINDRPVLRDYYLTVRRIGQPLALSRSERAAVYRTFENALNHTTFACD